MQTQSINEVFKAVVTERAYQEDKWTNSEASVAEYLIYMRKHLNKALDAMATDECVGVCDSVLSEIRKVTALGVACGEQHGMPIRHGYEGDFLFTSGDLIYLYDMNIYQCVCADSQQAVFAKIGIGKNPSSGDITITTIYENMLVVFNFENPSFEFQRVSLDDIKTGILKIT